MTKGISDTYTIARGDRKELYNVQYSKPGTLVPRKDVVEVEERIMWDGSIHTNLNEKDLSNIVKIIKEQNIKAVAVCYLHSYVNPQHEIQTREFLAQHIEDDVVISLSHEIAREWREYERASTAVMNSYIGPVTNLSLIHI